MSAWSPTRALVWEFTRVARAPVLGSVAASCALAALFHRMFSVLGERRDRVSLMILFTMFLIVNVATLTGRRDGGSGLQFDRRLFRLPAPTWLLVAGRLLAASLGATFMVVSVGLFMRWGLGARWPMLTLWLLTLACLAWLQSLGWTFARSRLFFVALLMPSLLVLVRWLAPRLRAYEPIVRPSPTDAATLLGVVALAYVISVIGVARDRSGAPLPHLDLAAPLRRAAAAVRRAPTLRGREKAPGPPVRGPLPAQIWMDWHEKGWMLPVGAAAGVLVTFAMGLLLPLGAERAVQSLTAFPLIGVVLVPPVVGFLYGRFHGSSDRAPIDPFRARRPLRDEQLAEAFFAGATLTLIATWIAGSASVVAALLALRVIGDAAAVDAAVVGLLDALGSLPLQTTVHLTLGLLGIAWTVMGTILAITLTGRNWVLGCVAAVPLSLVAGNFIGQVAFGVDVLPTALPLISAGVVVLAPFVTVVSAWAAWRRGLLSARLIGVLALCWALAALAAGVRMSTTLADLADARLTGLERLLSLMLPAALSLPALPVALAPLALRWNRHR